MCPSSFNSKGENKTGKEWGPKTIILSILNKLFSGTLLIKMNLGPPECAYIVKGTYVFSQNYNLMDLIFICHGLDTGVI